MNCVLAVWLRVRSFETIEDGKVSSMYSSLLYFSMTEIKCHCRSLSISQYIFLFRSCSLMSEGDDDAYVFDSSQYHEVLLLIAVLRVLDGGLDHPDRQLVRFSLDSYM